MRTHYVEEIKNAPIGAKVTLCGWVNKIRNHGKLIFINLRDRTGIMQILVDDSDAAQFSLASKIHNEYVLQVTGIIRERPADLINQEMVTGALELVAQNIKVLAQAEALPFNLDGHQEANDELRLRYRYLDLRRQEIGDKLRFRARLVKKMRDYLTEQGFTEVETPMLTKATPEGARDFLVPSRNFPGKFYALPQSPQIFKQLLMAAGIDRYFQVVKCFRDEDLRADRQPEFTQLDVEASFIDEAEIMRIHEDLLVQLFAELLQVELPQPFLQLDYQEAMLKYGSDKPDLRCDLVLTELTMHLAHCGFAVFEECAVKPRHRIAALRIPGGAQFSRKQLDQYAALTSKFGLPSLGVIKVNQLAQGVNGLQSSLLKFLKDDAALNIISQTVAKDGDLIFLAAGSFKIVSESLGALRLQVAEDLHLLRDEWRPLWVVNFPMFEEVEDGITFMHHPFTAPCTDDPEQLLADPLALRARAYDLVLNGTEIGGGSIRINNLAMQLAVFKILGIDQVRAEQQFGHLLNAFKYGYPPEGGIAFGVDRLAMLMTKAKSIREVIAFPKTQTGLCPLVQAPAAVESTAQLTELGIEVLPTLIEHAK